MKSSRFLLPLGVLTFCTALVNTPVVAHQESQQPDGSIDMGTFK